MGQSTFSGPIKSGTKKDTDELGPDNLGDTVLAQSGKITQSVTAVVTDIVIPAFSEIIRIDLIVDKAFDGTGNTISVGFNPTGDNLTDNDALASNPGLTSLTPNGDLADIRNWVNVGPNDVRIRFKNSTNGGGAGFLRFSYVQGRNQIINV